MLLASLYCVSFSFQASILKFSLPSAVDQCVVFEFEHFPMMHLQDYMLLSRQVPPQAPVL